MMTPTDLPPILLGLCVFCAGFLMVVGALSLWWWLLGRHWSREHRLPR
jgi:hypothetical protein